MPSGSFASRLPQFMRNAGGTFGMRFFGLGLQFIGSIMIARLLGVEGFGIYGYAFTCITIAGMLLGLGTGQLAVRELPRFVAHGQHDLLYGFLAMTLVMILGMGAIYSLLLIWAFDAQWLTIPIGWQLLVAGAVIHALILNLAAVLRGFQRILSSQFVEVILRQSAFLAMLALLIVAGYTMGPRDVLVLSILVSLPVLGLMFWMVWRTMRTEIPGRPGARLTLRVWIASALPLLVMTFANQMQTNLDILVLGVLADAADVGRYRAASRGADLMLIANSVALQVLGPMLSRSLALADKNPASDHTDTQQLISQSVLVSSVLGGGVCLILGAGAGFYMGLFGPDFIPAAPVLRILLAAQMIVVLCGPVGLVLVTLGRERLVMAFSLATLVLNLVLNLTLIPLFGIWGAAWATFIAVICLVVPLMFVVLRQTGFDPTLRPVLRRALARG